MTPTDVTSSIVLKDVSAVAQRDASQSQGIGQNANAASGASTNNDQTQTADITQNATASNSKDITVQAPKTTGGRVENFTVSVLVKDLFAGAFGNIDQGQGGAAPTANADDDTVEISREALEAENQDEAAVADEADTTEDSEADEETAASGTPLTDSRNSGVEPRPETPPAAINDSADPSRTAATGSRSNATGQPADSEETQTASEELKPAETRKSSIQPVQSSETESSPEAVTDTRSSGIIATEGTEEAEAGESEEGETPEAVTDSRQLLGVPVSEDADQTEGSEDAEEGAEVNETDGPETDEEVTEDAATDADETASTENSSDGQADVSGKTEGDETPPSEGEDTPADETQAETPAEVVDPAKALEDQPPILNPDELLSSSLDPQDSPTDAVSTSPVEIISSDAPAVESDAPIESPKEDPTKAGADEGTKEFNRAEEFAFDFGSPAGIFKTAFGDMFKNLKLTSPNGGIDRLEVRGTDLHDQVIGTKGLTSQVPISTDIIA